MRIHGSTVLLTGATGLLGQALAQELADQGADLVLTGRRQDILDPLAGKLDARAVAADLSSPKEVRRLMKAAGEVDIVIANAAMLAFGLISEFTPEEIDYLLDINLRSPVHLARLAAEGMTARKHGHLAFILSVAGKYATQRVSMYNCAKFGLRGYSRALRQELRPHGIGVSSILPGYIREPHSVKPEVKLPRWTGGSNSPEEIARATARAIEHNRGETIVSPFPVRLSATLAAQAPDLAHALFRRIDYDRVTREMHAGGKVHR
ncbi:SDR family NAD(P)-dependent oxidoreductase [Streptomyces sp. NPDC050617]|uniref:SDR family NAD(P)-dependent oxidoreductase n=1 Tax=Streptomyces sp. NPDC050617 TaxID=3154628 RepID=UPI0034389F5C